MSIDQEVGQTLALALRYGDNDGQRNEIERVVSAAVILRQVLGFELDQLGFGVFWAKPSEPVLSDEYGFLLWCPNHESI